MSPSIYLEEALKDVLRTSNFVHGMFNLIVAPCGSGKTTAAINVISKQASSPRTALILIDTTNGKQRLGRLKELILPYSFYEESLDRTWFPSAEFDPSKIVVTTYAQFGVWEYHNPGFHFFFDVIICDEAHNMIRFPNFKSKKKDQAPKINFAAIARDAICRAVWNCDTLVVGMTATPDNIGQLNCWINPLPIDTAALHHYETKNTYYYANLSELLWYLPKGKRGALYVTQVEKMLEHEQTAIAAGFKPICVWSPIAEHKMTPEQEAARLYILEHEEVPPQYDLLIFNDSLATSINLYGEMNFIIIHTSNESTITQARGRYRNHLENLYLHSVDECGVIVPPQYLNRRLYEQDYKELRAAIGIMDPNDSKRLLPKARLKQLLEANGYAVTENLRDRKGRYRTIAKREDV
ncbi:MAG: DEAD/DEAH box helicase family protein [Clostridia bacterium]|nr:DEAD/DEAH box helicase family protein [Clostridia bacterium]